MSGEIQPNEASKSSGGKPFGTPSVVAAAQSLHHALVEARGVGCPEHRLESGRRVDAETSIPAALQ
jgi:hypothetical protein